MYQEQPQHQQLITDDLDALLEVLPPHISQKLSPEDRGQLLEVVMDIGRLPEARYTWKEVTLSDREVTDADILYVVSRIGAFGEDNRAGIERTLHRISCIRNRTGRIVGLTSRVGRAVFGTITIIKDLVESGRSILLVGRPGVGKTTMLREVARVLSDDLRKRVVVVDTSNEIAGDGDIPHSAIGRARRMQVPKPSLQHAVMIEAVENHMPEVVIIDEISTEEEARAARTIAERGVQLVGTAHGNTLENLMMNPSLTDLIGGIQSVTLSDEEARRRGTQKSVLERKAPPTFDIIVEIRSFQEVAVHTDVAKTVDTHLRGRQLAPELRQLTEDGSINVTHPEPAFAPGGRGDRGLRVLPRQDDDRGERYGRGDRYERADRSLSADRYDRGDYERDEAGATAEEGPAMKVFAYGVSRSRLEQAIRGAHLPVRLVESLDGADAMLTLRNYFRRKPQVLRDAEASGIPVYVLKNHTGAQLEQGLTAITSATGGGTPVLEALREAEEAAHNVLSTGAGGVDLNPRNAYIRRLQHQVAQRYNLQSLSTGREPERRVRIFSDGGVDDDED